MARLRVEKLQELIRQELSTLLLMEVKDPRVKNVTVTSVELSNDLSYAKIFVSLYGSPEEQDNAFQGLKKALGYLRSEIAKRIRLRVAPILVLEKDTSYEYGAHIEEILHKINEDAKNNGQND